MAIIASINVLRAWNLESTYQRTRIKKVSLSFKANYILPYGPLHPFQRSRQHYSVFHQQAQ